MQQFGLKRGPEVYAYQLSAQAMATFILTILVMFVKPLGGYDLMFGICFLGLLSASVCTYLINDKTKVKYGDMYYDNVGILGSRKSNDSR